MPDISAYGDDAFIIRLGDSRDPQTHARMQAICNALQTQGLWRDILPGYDSVTARYDVLQMTPDAAMSAFKRAVNSPPSSMESGTIHEIPVCYEGLHALDLEAAAKTLNISETELIDRHSSPVYNVVFQGFLPGFTFCSAVESGLELPRHDTPRLSVPAGSVGIANWQTGIYGVSSPGGWQILGATPLPMFDPSRYEPFRLSAGDKIRFKPISAREFKRIKAAKL